MSVAPLETAGRLLAHPLPLRARRALVEPRTAAASPLSVPTLPVPTLPVPTLPVSALPVSALPVSALPVSALSVSAMTSLVPVMPSTAAEAMSEVAASATRGAPRAMTGGPATEVVVVAGWVPGWVPPGAAAAGSTVVRYQAAAQKARAVRIAAQAGWPVASRRAFVLWMATRVGWACAVRRTLVAQAKSARAAQSTAQAGSARAVQVEWPLASRQVLVL
ncbi:hypothetical protein [Actinoplanes sp. NPDC026623]|uniref:hypothetical protein n=1 Tax=Actinoplanes sp. NPDC026623 TaxID=3155610 RepID=UPI0033D2C724